MAERKLCREDTDFMREYIQEGVERGETQEQIQKRRRQLAELFTCTLPQVVGAVAWKHCPDQEKLVLIPLELSSQDTSVGGHTSTPSEQPVENPRTERAAQAVSSIEIPIVVPDASREDTVQVSSTDSEENTPTDKVRFHPKGGAWADYEHSEIKERWRVTEAKFVDENVDPDPEKCAKMRILCTPGIKCYLEMRHILAEGFKPENVTAVERDDKAWSDFETNAKALGIRPVFGELSEVLQRQRAPFDVALIDFVGQQSIPSLEVLNRLPLAKRAVVAITTMAKRENPQLQYSMATLHKRYEGHSQEVFARAVEEKIEAIIAEGNYQVGNIVGDAIRQQNQWEQEQEGEVSHSIRDTTMWHLLRQLGSLSMDNLLMGKWIEKTNMPLKAIKEMGDQGPRKGLSEEQWRALLIEEAMQTLSSMTMEFETLTSSHRSRKRKMFTTLRRLGSSALVTEKMIAKLEKYYYKSKIGQVPSPFFTNLAVVDTPIEEYRKMMPSINFVFTCCRAIIADAAARFTRGGARHDFGVRLEANGLHDVFNGTARIAFFDNGKRITSISLRHITDDLNAFDELQSRYPLTDYENQKKIPRIALEDLQS